MLCNDLVTAGADLGGIDGGLPEPTRSVVQRSRALLHHRCSHRTMRDYVSDGQWFCCERPEAPVDENTLFDANCPICREMWDRYGRQFWAMR